MYTISSVFKRLSCLRRQIIALLLFGLGVVGSAAAQVGQVEQLRGAVSAMSGNEALRELQREDVVYRADTIQTGPTAFTDLRLLDGSLLSVEDNTRVKIAEYIPGEEPQSMLELFSGNVRSQVGSAFSSQRNSFRIRTATALMGVQGTDFWVHAEPTLTRIVVYEGVVLVASSNPLIERTELVRAGQSTIVPLGEAPQPVASVLNNLIVLLPMLGATAAAVAENPGAGETLASPE